ncbi:MAG: diacylglycerol kinase [Patescibacteria group bacterium]
MLKHIHYATRGLFHVFQTEVSFRVQLGVAIVVLVMMNVYPLMNWERIILLLLIGSVLVLEVINSVLERLVDSFKPRVHPVVGEIKDMMAGAVLVSSVVSAIVGVLIFWPYV